MATLFPQPANVGMATKASPMGVALATPATTTGQPNPIIDVSAKTGTVPVTPPTTSPLAPINVSSLTDIKGPRTNALAEALIGASKEPVKGPWSALGNLGQYWAGIGEQRKYEASETERANLPTKQIQEYVAGGGVIDAAHAKELIATGAEPLVKLGTEFLTEQAKASFKSGEHTTDPAGNIIQEVSPGNWQKVYNAERGVRAMTPEEQATFPGANPATTGIDVATGQPVEWPSGPNANSEVGQILQDAARGVYGTGEGADKIVETLVNRALQGWHQLTPEEVAARGLDPSMPWQLSPEGELSGATKTGTIVNVGPNGEHFPDLGTEGRAYVMDENGKVKMFPREDGTGYEPHIYNIPGGKADEAAKADEATKSAAKTNLGAKGGIVVQDIGRLIDEVENSRGATTGLGSLLKFIPGTPSARVAGLLRTIVGHIGFAGLSQMRSESKTGAALGNITVREIEFLQALQGDLEQSTDPDTIIYNAKRIANIWMDMVHGVGVGERYELVIPVPMGSGREPGKPEPWQPEFIPTGQVFDGPDGPIRMGPDGQWHAPDDPIFSDPSWIAKPPPPAPPPEGGG